ncbi:MAG: hypothetical protein AAFU79_04425 [Myxococcota bacterium]
MTERVGVPFSVVPFGRAWVAVLLGASGVALAVGFGFTLAERARAQQAGFVAQALSAHEVPEAR